MVKLHVEAMFFTLLDLQTTIGLYVTMRKKQKAQKSMHRMNAILLGWRPKPTAHMRIVTA